MERSELAAAIFRASHLEGEFLLRSGTRSREYFDKYRFESDPSLLLAITAAFKTLVPANVQALAGLELGGVPLATMLSQATGLPTLFVRKTPKQYGTCQLAEGGRISGKDLLLVEDVVTSGGQLIELANALRSLGGIVSDALCVIDREAGGPARLVEAGIRLHSLFRMSELKKSAG